MVQLQFGYSQFAFEPIFSCVPFVRSSRHKIRVEKERKKERKKKLAQDYMNAVLRTALKTETPSMYTSSPHPHPRDVPLSSHPHWRNILCVHIFALTLKFNFEKKFFHEMMDMRMRYLPAHL